jgi:hypothetical protein
MLLDFFGYQAHPCPRVQNPTPTEAASLETTPGLLSKSNWDATLAEGEVGSSLVGGGDEVGKEGDPDKESGDEVYR